MTGIEFTIFLKLLCQLQSNERILDIGCGSGIIALPLLESVDLKGSYVGLDIHKQSIQWCQRNISTQYPQFIFQHVDIKNKLYNPSGNYSADNYSFQFDDHSFDVILLKSVFTHIQSSVVENYFKEISRLLSSHGRCLATFFLLNERQGDFAKKGLNCQNFKYGCKQWRYVYKNSPESAIAHNEKHILSLLQKNSLELAKPIMYGTWSGFKNGLSYQDMMLIHKI
jgi:ubiquinone/menaquinone biosynthesis C-methylase UbiE